MTETSQRCQWRGMNGDALYEAYSEVTPLQVFDDDEEDDDEVLDEDLESLEE